MYAFLSISRRKKDIMFSCASVPSISSLLVLVLVLVLLVLFLIMLIPPAPPLYKLGFSTQFEPSKEGHPIIFYIPTSSRLTALRSASANTILDFILGELP